MHNITLHYTHLCAYNRKKKHEEINANIVLFNWFDEIQVHKYGIQVIKDFAINLIKSRRVEHIEFPHL